VGREKRERSRDEGEGSQVKRKGKKDEVVSDKFNGDEWQE
jgi:hypothetical protein